MSAAATVRAARGRAKAAPLENTLHIGDCLLTLEDLRETYGEFADLVYLDPPFNSDQNYNRVFRGRDSNWDKMKWRGGAAQAKKMDALEKAAFHDAWQWTEDTRADCESFIRAEDGSDIGEFMSAMRQTLASPGRRGRDRETLAYLTYMVPRLAAIRGVMRDSGAVYLHCDATASHYLKAAMDAVFGADNFRNEIVWKKYAGRKNNAARKFSTQNDNLLFYVKSRAADARFSPVMLPLSDREIEEKYRHTDRDGRRYRLAWGRAYQQSGRQRRIYLEDDEGNQRLTRAGNLWVEDGLQLNTSADERLGYPTQKPIALLRRIVAASSRTGDIVMDPFCGCGTTLAACHESGRKFVGIDVSRAAADVIKTRMKKFYGRAGRVKENGEAYPAFRRLKVGINLPATGRGWARIFASRKAAEDEARLRDRAHAFQHDAIAAIPLAKQLEGERPQIAKKGRDGGIDGLLYLVNDLNVRDSIVISVKHHRAPNQNQVDELLRVVSQNNALMGLLITLVPPSPGMKAAAAVEQTIPIRDSDGTTRRYNRAVILTFDEVKAGKFRDVLPYHLAVDPDSPDRLGVEKARRRRGG